jgi:hypothetical protein
MLQVDRGLGMAGRCVPLQYDASSVIASRERWAGV